MNVQQLRARYLKLQRRIFMVEAAAGNIHSEDQRTAYAALMKRVRLRAALNDVWASLQLAQGTGEDRVKWAVRAELELIDLQQLVRGVECAVDGLQGG